MITSVASPDSSGAVGTTSVAAAGSTGKYLINLTGHAGLTERMQRAKQVGLRMRVPMLVLLPSLLFGVNYLVEAMAPGDCIELIGRPKSRKDRTRYTFRLTRNTRHQRFYNQTDALRPAVGMQADFEVQVRINGVWQAPPPPPLIPATEHGQCIDECGPAVVPRTPLSAGKDGVMFLADAPSQADPWRVGVTLYPTADEADGDNGTMVWSDPIAPLPPDPPTTLW